MTHFILQQNINENDLNDLIECITETHNTYETFYHIPFDTSYPKILNTINVFVYAASSVTDEIYNNEGCVFNHTSEINMHDYYEKTPSMMWSPRAFQGTLQDVTTLLEHTDIDIFVRPAIDNKLFSGQVCTQSEFIDMAKQMIEADSTLANEEIFIGSINYPEYEYRLFVVGGKVVASSQYRVNGDVIPLEGSPPNVKKLAEKFYKLNKLPSACVIDIGTGYDNDSSKIGIIEVNSIHNSGFYDIIKKDLINSIAEYVG